ncbi:response regulator transcription factor [Gracilibacillus sp. S3-1-1]|uniref:Response regulator transcription factor n=1 Tax=Gracilibacillus pellucidus TaxID=3095368 RepID=A0ACC6M0I0_9BACI|nr:response regulator transcription factor [Gracilibacillus sp. S3-1-1]MDX8044443.1 response regulator transcription factor [Gracilibacillus sp. S3-1-1]
MNEKILVVDDEKDIVSFMQDSLADEGYLVYCAYSSTEALRALSCHPDLIILDVMMPEMDGFELCDHIRKSVSAPIIFVSAKKTEQDRIKGLMVGGDDYIEKPFSMKELKIRIYAHLRREQRMHGKTQRRLFQKNLVIDMEAYELYCNDVQIPFTYREFEIVQYFVLHPNQVLSREQIYEQVWGIDAMGDSTTVTEHIKKIRSKLQQFDPDTTYISTVWGVGYKWES